MGRSDKSQPVRRLCVGVVGSRAKDFIAHANRLSSPPTSEAASHGRYVFPDGRPCTMEFTHMIGLDAYPLMLGTLVSTASAVVLACDTHKCIEVLGDLQATVSSARELKALPAAAVVFGDGKPNAAIARVAAKYEWDVYYVRESETSKNTVFNAVDEVLTDIASSCVSALSDEKTSRRRRRPSLREAAAITHSDDSESSDHPSFASRVAAAFSSWRPHITEQLMKSRFASVSGCPVLARRHLAISLLLAPLFSIPSSRSLRLRRSRRARFM
eukprot:Opistho-1_new@79945